MALFTLPDIKISGLSVCVPQQTEDNRQLTLLSEKERDLFIRTVGIRYRRVARKGITAADLCLQAAEELLQALAWNRDEVNALIFITQTPDYIIPNTSSLLQEKLHLSKQCLVFDVNLGCSGYVYGLSILGSILHHIPQGKALLLVGDVSTATISKADRSTTPLFSDAGSATALVQQPDNNMFFHLQTDGKGYDAIIVPEGGFRNRATADSFVSKEIAQGVNRCGIDMILDGAKIFTFSLREVVPNIQTLLRYAGIDKETPDYYIFHQANLLMVESLRKKLGANPDKVPYSLQHYGNTGSASIPLTLAAQLRHKLSREKLKLLLSGFGVGLSWGSAYLETENLLCLPIIEMK